MHIVGKGVTVATWNTSMRGDFSWMGDHLLLRTPQHEGSQAETVDLIFDPTKQSWTGTLGTGNSVAKRTLMRPSPPRLAGAPLGVWRNSVEAGDDSRFVHIAAGSDGKLVIWTDLHASARQHGAGTTERVEERFGDRSPEPREAHDGTTWTLTVGNDLGGDTFTGGLSDDGDAFMGSSMHYGNGGYMPGSRATPFS